MTADLSTLKEAKAKLSGYRNSLNRKALRAYQEEWVRTQRDSKILDGSKQTAIDFSGSDHFQSLCLLVPERGRLTPLMASDNPLSPAEMWRAIQDLHSLYVRVSTNPLSPRSRTRRGRLSCGAVQTQAGEVSFLEDSVVRSDD